MVLDTTETRLNRAENDIETLRTTQTNILNHLDGYSKTLNETRDIAAENRERLGRLEEIALETRDIARQNHERLGSMEDRQKQMDDRQNEMANDIKRNTDRLDNVERVLLENSAAIRENRIILLSLAENAGLTIEKPEAKIERKASDAT